MRSIRKCNVCVVGGAGFLGSHLVDHLIDDRECNVLVVDNLISGRREFIHPKATFEYADITGSETYLRELFAHHNIQFVFNYAAEPYIPVSFARPIHVFNINAFGAMKVINAAQEAGCEGILQVSSAEIYGGCVSGKINEDYPVCPHSTYGAAKAAIDNLIQVRWKEARTPCIALRQFNCLGPRETHSYIVPEVISQACNILEEKASCFWLGNNSYRDFLYAGDAVRMACSLLEQGNFGEVYNLGSENGIKIYDLAKKIGHLMLEGNDIEIVEDPTRVRPWEIWHLQADCTKLYNTITERPTVSLDQALEKTIQYFWQIGARWVWER